MCTEVFKWCSLDKKQPHNCWQNPTDSAAPQAVGSRSHGLCYTQFTLSWQYFSTSESPSFRNPLNPQLPLFDKHGVLRLWSVYHCCSEAIWLSCDLSHQWVVKKIPKTWLNLKCNSLCKDHRYPSFFLVKKKTNWFCFYCWFELIYVRPWRVSCVNNCVVRINFWHQVNITYTMLHAPTWTHMTIVFMIIYCLSFYLMSSSSVFLSLHWKIGRVCMYV